MKIELGGFTHARPGWENLDLTTGYDISKELLRRYADESADVIYSSHFVEHLPMALMPALCADIYRVLRPGGAVRLAGPDADIFTERHLRGSLADFVDSFWPEARQQGVSERDIYLNMLGNPDRAQFGVPGGIIGHAWPASANLVIYFLVHGGFEPSNIWKAPFRVSSIPELCHETFDNRPSHSFYVEARKAHYATSNAPETVGT